MKTKTMAISFMLTFTSCALFAQQDTIPKRDTIPTDPKKDSIVSFKSNANENLTVFNFSTAAKRDTVPSPTDTIPKKDSLVGLNSNAGEKLTVFNFSVFAKRDTIPSPTDTVPKKDSLALAYLKTDLKSSLNISEVISEKDHSGLMNAMKEELAYTLPESKNYKAI